MRSKEHPPVPSTYTTCSTRVVGNVIQNHACGCWEERGGATIGAAVIAFSQCEKHKPKNPL